MCVRERERNIHIFNIIVHMYKVKYLYISLRMSNANISFNSDLPIKAESQPRSRFLFRLFIRLVDIKRFKKVQFLATK